MDPDSGSHERPEPPSTPPAPQWGLAFELGIRLGVSVLLGLGLGLLADSWLETNGLLILAGLLLGAAAAMVTIWKVASGAMRR